MSTSETGNCDTCHWFEGDRDNDCLLGQCRYDSPSMGGFPSVYPDNWCGDHRAILRELREED